MAYFDKNLNKYIATRWLSKYSMSVSGMGDTKQQANDMLNDNVRKIKNAAAAHMAANPLKKINLAELLNGGK